MADKTTTSYRIDTVDPGDVELLAPQQGPGGALFVEGVVARPGIYEYRNPDGSVRRELVPRENLWRVDSIGTLARAAVTIEHPPVMITPDNVRTYSHGDASDEVIETAGGFVKIRMALRTRESQDAANAGKLQLSPGYKVDCLEVGGVDPEFGEYDAIQVSREYNHIAMTDRARGGGSMSFRVDSADLPVLIGGPASQEYQMPDIQIARDFVARLDSMKAQRDALLSLRADGVEERMIADRAVWEVWDDLYDAHDAVLVEVRKALELEDDSEIQSALAKVGADFKALTAEIVDAFAKALAGNADVLRMDEDDEPEEREDAAPPPPPRQEEDPQVQGAPPAEGQAPPAPAEGAAPPAGEGGVPPAEGGPAAAEGGETGEGGTAEVPPGPEGDPAVPADGSQANAAAEPLPGEGGQPPAATPDVPPTPEESITAQQLQGAMDNLLERFSQLLAPLLLLFPQGGELPGRTDSGVAAWEALRDALEGTNRTDSSAAQSRLDAFLADGLRYQILRTRLDSVAREIGIDYEGISLGDLSRSVVGKLAPEVKFDSEADYIAAAQVLRAPTAKTIERVDSAKFPLPTPTTTIYGPQSDD